MTYRTAAWFDRQLAHAQECLAEADRVHTPEELAAARAALAMTPNEPQTELFHLQDVRATRRGEAMHV